MSQEEVKKDPIVEEPVEEIIEEQVAREEPVSEKSSKKSRGRKASKQDEITEAKQELGEMKEKYLRLYAEYDNFRRRTAKEKIELSRTGNDKLILELLPVLDDTERAIDAIQRTDENLHLVEGIDLIRSKLFRTLEKNGLIPMDSKGKDFDTDQHEAITQFPAPEESMKGKVIEVIEKGYLLHDKVLRFAKVVVGT